MAIGFTYISHKMQENILSEVTRDLRYYSCSWLLGSLLLRCALVAYELYARKLYESEAEYGHQTCN